MHDSVIEALEAAGLKLFRPTQPLENSRIFTAFFEGATAGVAYAVDIQLIHDGPIRVVGKPPLILPRNKSDSRYRAAQELVNLFNRKKLPKAILYERQVEVGYELPSVFLAWQDLESLGHCIKLLVFSTARATEELTLALEKVILQREQPDRALSVACNDIEATAEMFACDDDERAN